MKAGFAKLTTLGKQQSVLPASHPVNKPPDQQHEHLNSSWMFSIIFLCLQRVIEWVNGWVFVWEGGWMDGCSFALRRHLWITIIKQRQQQQQQLYLTGLFERRQGISFVYISTLLFFALTCTRARHYNRSSIHPSSQPTNQSIHLAN